VRKETEAAEKVC